MRNLELLHCLPVEELEGTRTPSCFTVDCDTGIVYVATGSGITGFSPSNHEVTLSVSLVSGGFLSAAGHSGVIGIQHLPDHEAICVATSSGDVILLSLFTEELECVGSVDSGLTCMAWSPDQEIVVFSTGENTLIMMTKDFDPISEFSIHSEEFGSEEPVNVGWGKKETQFHGSAGKPSPETLKEVELTPASVWDDKGCRLSWRGDGQYFAASVIDPNTGARKLCMWNREGVLTSTSEKVPGLEEPLCWKPSGSLIASTQRRPHRHEVVFFEKNGLRHGEFTLPFKQMEVKVVEVLWNCNSSLLVVWVEDLPPEDERQHENFLPQSRVQLWSVSNYHWYLKQELVFPASSGDRVACVAWDPEAALRLHIICEGGRYLCCEYGWTTVHTRGHSNQNPSTVAVIDGARLLLTPARHVVVPPPMAAHSVDFPRSVQGVAFAPPPDSSDAAVLLRDATIAFLKGHVMDEFQPPGQPPQTVSTCSIEVPDSSGLWTGPGAFRQLTWWRQDLMVAVGRDQMLNKDLICELRMHKTDDGVALELIRGAEVDEPVLCLFANADTGTLAVELNTGSILKYTSEDTRHVLVPWENSRGRRVSLPQPCPVMETARVGQEEVILGLTEHCRLYVNDQEVASNCTSFAVHDEFLLLTTHAHTLRCVDLQSSKHGLCSLVGEDSHPLDENIRRVERGSRIVVAVPLDTKVVLQMPRGNLETIHPRALLLSFLRKCLDRLQYRDALMAMRRHRINLNLIYDHNPKLFLENVKRFIQQVESVSLLNLFLSDLKEEDVTSTMYADYYTHVDRRFALFARMQDITSQGHSDQAPGGLKVDLVCDALREALASLDKNKYLLSILTSHVKKTKSELETALSIIKELKAEAAAGVTGEHVTCEEALKYVLFLVDVNQAYDVALGMYDFQLVLMVAEKSQKDPKEYLPFLNNLRKMEVNYQRSTIDKYLKRYSKAVEHLSKCGPEKFDELLSLVKDQSLYKVALGLYSKSTSEYKSLALAYGQFLIEKKRCEEAGLVLTRSGAHTEALVAFQKSGNWRQAFCMSSLLEHTEEEQLRLARTLADYLKEHNRHSEAARVLEDYAHDTEEAIAVLITGREWEEALRLMYKSARTDIIETHLREALREGCSSEIADLESKRELLEKYTTRLLVVRDKRERERLELAEGGGVRDDVDLYSDASSVSGVSGQSSDRTGSSRGTRSTGRSSRNRKKAERKKYSLKEGSRFEDVGLMMALAALIETTDKSTEEICALLKMLVLFDYEDEGKALQKEYRELRDTIDRNVKVIWPPDGVQQSRDVSQVTGPGATVNSIVAAMTTGPADGQTHKNPDEPEKPQAPVLRKELPWELDILKA